MTENERLNELAEHYYAVAADMKFHAIDALKTASRLEATADQLCELAMKAADAGRKPQEETT